MFYNISSIDKIVRFIIGTLAIAAALLYHPLFVILALAMFLSVATSSCLVYKVLGINKNIELKNRYLSLLPRYNPAPVLIFCDQGRVLFQNDAARTLLQSLREFTQLGTELSPHEIIAANKELTLRYKESYQLVLRGNKHENFIMVYGFDITTIVRQENELRSFALNDGLSGLANRKKLILDLQSYPTRALSLIDVKNFAEINAFYGHEKGDGFLREFARMLEHFAPQRRRDIYRIQSDIFAVLWEQEELFLDEIEQFFAQRYISVEGIEFAVEVTLAHARLHEENRSLLTIAESTLMEAKKRGVKVLDYAPHLDFREQYLANLEWSKKIKHILAHEDNARLVAFFQPIQSTQSGRIEKYETLARVVDGERVSPPNLFIEAAKQMGLLPKITTQMLDIAFAYAAKSDAEFSVNITIQDLQNESFYELLVTLLQKHAIQASRIVLELLEDEEIYDYLEILEKIKALGFQIAIDDFGTGYSNFAKLQQIEADYIKIDGSLIKTIDSNPQHLEVVRTINAYAHGIGAKTIAEFVYNETIAALLREEKMDFLQGYAIGKPSPKLLIEFLQEV